MPPHARSAPASRRMRERAQPPAATREQRDQRLSLEDARARITAAVQPVAEVESIALRAALGRVLVADIVSPINVPAHTNAAVDGYAMAAADLAAHETLRVIGTARAGRPRSERVRSGECVHVMTGAPMPAGTDTVVAQELTERSGDVVRIVSAPEPGQNVRAAGEDLALGQLALSRGKRLLPAELGLIASLGFAETRVHRRVRVAYFCTGDELRSAGEALGEGQIYDSNRYTLYGMLARLSVDMIDRGVVRDEPDAVRREMAAATTNADAVITTGGVSVGEADHVKAALSALGTLDFSQVAMRPGRPFTFGRIGEIPFFGLPGNPVAVMVAFYQLVQPALQRMMGEAVPAAPLTFHARTMSRLKTRLGRTEIIRGVLERDEHGALIVRSTGGQGSGILRSMSIANCFIILPPERGDAQPGDIVDVQPFFGPI